MQSVTFVTRNNEKYSIAKAACTVAGFSLDHRKLDIDEIQGEDPVEISLDKAQKAYEQLKSPIVINDDSWSFLGLNGFPGPYMKSMTHWLTAQDFINLTRDLKDRRVILTQIIVYQDAGGTEVFQSKFGFSVLAEARGNYGNALQKIIAASSDNGLSVAEAYDNGTTARNREVAVGWDKFAAWYKQKVEDV